MKFGVSAHCVQELDWRHCYVASGKVLWPVVSVQQCNMQTTSCRNYSSTRCFKN